MASNAPVHTSKVKSTRVSYKLIKLRSPAISRTYQQATIVSVNAKDANKDKERDRKVKRQSNLFKKHGKRADAAVPATAGTAASGGPARADACSASLLSRHINHIRHADQAQYFKRKHKSRMDKAASRSKCQRTITEEAGIQQQQLTNKHPKEAKSLEKGGEAGGHRQTGSRNQSHNTKQFFDKYFKFAYDLSTPEGVRQLEAHFFPTTSTQIKQNRKRSDAGDVTEKRNIP